MICSTAALQIGRLLVKSTGFTHSQTSETLCSFT